MIMCFSLDYSYASLNSMFNEIQILRKNISHVFLFTWDEVYSIQSHFQQYFSYIVAASFIGGVDAQDAMFNCNPLKQDFKMK